MLYCFQVHQSLSKVNELLVRSIVYLSLSLEAEKQYTEKHHPNSDIEDEILSVKNELLDLLCVMDKIHAVKRFRYVTRSRFRLQVLAFHEISLLTTFHISRNLACHKSPFLSLISRNNKLKDHEISL